MQYSTFRKNRARLRNKTRKRVRYDDFSVSSETLTMMDASMKNFKAGVVFGPVDLSEPELDFISGILKGKVPNDIDRHSLREERSEIRLGVRG